MLSSLSQLKDHLPTYSCPIIIMADAQDPYYRLAQEISESETAPITGSIEEALECNPTYLLWVASPDGISVKSLINLGIILQESHRVISIGIISGSTLENARDLWKNSTRAKGEKFYAVSAANPSAGINEGQIQFFKSETLLETLHLDKENLLSALSQADYLSFTGHGGYSYWVLDKENREELISENIPRLPATVVSSSSCQTFQPWEAHSIALRFIDQGAIVYAGFLFSPNEGYLIGEFDDLPFRYTWPDFPIGHVVQVQNLGTVQGFATFPYYFMLGDPRTGLQSKAPYDLIQDQRNGKTRFLKLKNAPAGLVPIHIPDGAAYNFITVPGNTSASQHDPFYNSRLQMANIQDDKYILLIHPGGDINIRLQLHPPWYWFLIDPISDALDHTLLFTQQTAMGGDLTTLMGGMISLLITFIRLKRNPAFKIFLRPAIILGISIAGLHSMYFLQRLECVTITSKEFLFSPWALIGTLALSTSGSFTFWNSRTRFNRILSLLIPTYPTWLMSIFGFGVISLSGIHYTSKLGAPVWNYSIGEMPLLVFCVQLPFFAAVFVFLEKLAFTRKRASRK